MLDAISHVGLHISFVVYPCNAEFNEAVGNTNSLDKVRFFKFGMLVVLFFNRAKYLTDSLNIFRFVRISEINLTLKVVCFLRRARK